MSMSEQRAPNGIEWTRVYGRRGYTWNPIKGCNHGCRWRMPDGKIAICYAEEVANGKNPGIRKSYPGGFAAVHFREDILYDPKALKASSGIFCDSMSDLFGVGTREEWTDRVIEVIAGLPQHIFFALTKNAPRLKKHQIPRNLWVGLSAPATFMFGKELSEQQQRAWFDRSLEALGACNAWIKWVSLEPLSMDLSQEISRARSFLKWAVIGAASNGREKIQPNQCDFANTLIALDGIPVFFKGNISPGLAHLLAGGWKDNFPDIGTI